MTELSAPAEGQTSASADAVKQARDAAELTDPVSMAALTDVTVEQRSVEDALDGAGTTADEASQRSAAVPSEPVPTVVVDDPPRSVSPHNDQPTLSRRVLDSEQSGTVGDAATNPRDAPSGDDVDRRSSGTGDPDSALETSLPSTTAAGPLSSVARHALPSAVAAPRAGGKHRLPPVLTTSTGQGHPHGVGRVSPLSLVVGGAAEAVRSSSSLTGGTRLGDLGLGGAAQSQPPLNLSVGDQQAVNMKLSAGAGTVTTAHHKSATVDAATSAAAPAGSYTLLVPCFLKLINQRISYEL